MSGINFFTVIFWKVDIARVIVHFWPNRPAVMTHVYELVMEPLHTGRDGKWEQKLQQ